MPTESNNSLKVSKCHYKNNEMNSRYSKYALEQHRKIKYISEYKINRAFFTGSCTRCLAGWLAGWSGNAVGVGATVWDLLGATHNYAAQHDTAAVGRIFHIFKLQFTKGV